MHSIKILQSKLFFYFVSLLIFLLFNSIERNWFYPMDQTCSKISKRTTDHTQGWYYIDEWVKVFKNEPNKISLYKTWSDMIFLGRLYHISLQIF